MKSDELICLGIFLSMISCVYELVGILTRFVLDSMIINISLVISTLCGIAGAIIVTIGVILKIKKSKEEDYD